MKTPLSEDFSYEMMMKLVIQNKKEKEKKLFDQFNT